MNQDNNMTQWDPQQYQQFEKERHAPFDDLLSLIKPTSKMSVLDLGCGDGKLTARLHQSLQAEATLGIDSSKEMLEEAHKIDLAGITFKSEDVEKFKPKKPYDLIFSNACLQWMPNHPELFQKISHWLAADGQLAIQVPSNFDFPTHTIAKDLALEAPYNDFLEAARQPSVLKPEDYAMLLYQLKFKDQSVRLQVYTHELPSTESVIEWVKESLLTHYRNTLPPELYQKFFETYRKHVLKHFGQISPFFFAFKRILIWAQK